MSLAEAFEPLRDALERTGIRYAVGGSWASTAFGEPRFTNDVDILAELTQRFRKQADECRDESLHNGYEWPISLNLVLTQAR